MKSGSLFDTMAQGVEDESARMLSAAREEGESILAEARARAVALRDSTLQGTHAEMRVLDERWKQKADSEAVKAALSMKNSVVEEALGRVEKQIAALTKGPEFGKILDAFLQELMDAAGDLGDIVVIAPQSYVDHVRRWLQDHGHGHVPVEGSATLMDGVAIQDPARSFRISNTLRGRYRRVDQETRKISMTGLFGV